MYRVALCIKGIDFIKQMENIILNYASINCFNIEVTSFRTPNELYDEMQFEREKNFDLLFIGMNHSNDSMSGIQLGNWIRNVLRDEWVQIIYLSEKQEVSLEIFETRPFNYRLMPVERKSIESDLKGAMELQRQSSHFFQYKSGGSVKIVNVLDIIYFESIGHKISIIMKNQQKDTFYGKMCNIAQHMTKYTFIWIHNSYLVNYQFTNEYSKKQIKLTDGTILPISRAYMKNLTNLELYFNYVGAKSF